MRMPSDWNTSRAYPVREGNIYLLTKDDTYAEVLANSGVEPSAASKKTLLQALGVSSEITPPLSEILLLLGDYLLDVVMCCLWLVLT
jgi:serine/threonine protein phosphatase PrpC